jgi:hypothetical protein
MPASMRLDGSTACMTVENATDTEVFRAHVREVLCPALRPGDLVVMDSLSPHKHDPPRCNWLNRAGRQSGSCQPVRRTWNPIEKMWSKVKQCLRSAEAGTREELRRASAAAPACVTARDAINWFASCG